MAEHVAGADVVITAALVPGTQALVLITEQMVRNMRCGSVIVDLAADHGGNCELTQRGGDVIKFGVAILGPSNLPSSMPFHASKMYARTVTNLLLHLSGEGNTQIDLTDELTRATVVTHAGAIVHEANHNRLIS